MKQLNAPMSESVVYDKNSVYELIAVMEHAITLWRKGELSRTNLEALTEASAVIARLMKRALEMEIMSRRENPENGSSFSRIDNIQKK